MFVLADMVIFHEPDGLEFAGRGKHLGFVRLAKAKEILAVLRNTEANARPVVIQMMFEQHFPQPEPSSPKQIEAILP